MIPILPVSTEYIQNIYATERTIVSKVRITNTQSDAPRQVITHDFSTKVQGNTVSNPSNAKYRLTTGALSAPTTFFTVEATQAQYDSIDTDDGNNWVSTSVATVNTKAFHYYGFDIIGVLEDYYGETLWGGKTLIADKIAIAKSIITRLTVNWEGFGSVGTVYKATLESWLASTSAWDTATAVTHTANTPTLLTLTSLSTNPTDTPANKIDANGFFHVTAFAEAANGTSGSSLRTNYVWLEIETMVKTYDDNTVVRLNVLEEISILNDALPSNELELSVSNESGDFDYITFQNMHKILASKPKIEADLGLVLIEEDQKVIPSNMIGKIKGSIIENPHIFKYPSGGSPTIVTPSTSMSEFSQGAYDQSELLDGVVISVNYTTNTNMAQFVLGFNVLEMLENEYGLAIWQGKTTTLDKVAIARAIISRLDWDVTGYGHSPTGYLATLQRWNLTGWTGTWTTTASAPTLVTAGSVSSYSAIADDGFSYLLWRAEASDGVTGSNIVLDYAECRITVNPQYVVEWKPVGTYFMTDWKNDVTNKIVSFVANDYFALFSDISYEPTAITNLKDLAVDVLTKGGVPTSKQVVDNALSLITVNPVADRTDIRSLLQNIGIAGVSCVGQDRYGNVFIKPFLTIDQVSNYITYPSTQPVVYGGYTSPTMYPITNTAGGMKYLDYEQMYEPPEVSLQKSIYQLVVKYFPNGNADDGIELTYTNASIGGTSGESFSISNPLVKTTAQANKISEWYFRETNYNAFFTTSWRQNPALEATDLILVEDAFGSEKQSRITKQELTYEGYLEGVTESRGGV